MNGSQDVTIVARSIQMIVSIVANWVNLLLRLASVLVLYPFLVGTLGKEQYALWLLIVAITGNFTLLRLGVPMATVRYMSEAHARGDQQRVNEVLGTSLGVFLAMGILVAIGGASLTGILDSAFSVPDQYTASAKAAFLFTVLACAIGFPLEVLEASFHAFERFVVLNLIGICMLVLRVALLLLCVTEETGILAIAVIYGGEALLQALIFYFYLKRKVPRLQFSLRHFKKSMLKVILGYSVYVLVLHASRRVAFQTDPIVIGAMISPAAIVFFGVANQIMTQLMLATSGVVRVVMPRASILHSEQKFGELRQLYLDATRLAMLGLAPICTALFVVGDDFLALWMGEEFRGPAGIVLQILALSYLPFLVQGTVGDPVLMATSKVKFPTLTMAVAALANLGLSLALAPKYGIEGVAWGTAIPNVLYAALLTLHTTRKMEVPLAQYAWATLATPMLGLAVFLAPLLAFAHFFAINSFVKLGLVITISLLPYAIITYKLILPMRQRVWIRQKLLGRSAATSG